MEDEKSANWKEVGVEKRKISSHLEKKKTQEEKEMRGDLRNFGERNAQVYYLNRVKRPKRQRKPQTEKRDSFGGTCSAGKEQEPERIKNLRKKRGRTCSKDQYGWTADKHPKEPDGCKIGKKKQISTTK